MIKNNKGGNKYNFKIIMKEYTISYKNKEFKVQLSEDDESTYINFGELPQHCGRLHIYKDDIDAQLDHIQPIPECSKPNLKIPNEGYIMIELIIIFLKHLKNELKIKNLILSDFSWIVCDKSKISLSKIYILTHGYPWYYKFGFKSLKNHSDNLNNNNIMNTRTNNSIDIIKIINNELKSNKSDKIKKYIIDNKFYLFDKFKIKDQLIKDTLNIISKENCIILIILIDSFYKELGLVYHTGDTLFINL